MQQLLKKEKGFKVKSDNQKEMFMVKGPGRSPKVQAHHYQMPTKTNKVNAPVTGLVVKTLKALKFKGASIRNRGSLGLKNKETKHAQKYAARAFHSMSA